MSVLLVMLVPFGQFPTTVVDQEGHEFAAPPAPSNGDIDGDEDLQYHALCMPFFTGPLKTRVG